MTEAEKKKILEDYSSGKSGTRATIEQIGGHDYADLLIALGKYNLGLPPSYTKGREDHIRRASEILQPLLIERHGE